MGAEATPAAAAASAGAPPAAAAPAAAATPTPAAATPAAGATPAAPDLSQPIQPKEGESSVNHLKRVMETRLAAQKAAEAAATKAAEPGKPAEAAAAEPGKAAEVKPGEKLAEEAKPGETKPGETKPEEKVAAAEGLVPEDELTLEPTKILSPKDFAESIKGNAELAKALEGSPQVKDAVMKALRVANESAEIRTLLPTKQAAEYAIGQAKYVHELTSAFTSGKPEDMQKFIATLAQESYLTDPDTGQPVNDPATGMPLTDGSFERFCSSMGDTILNAIDKNYTGNEKVLAAVKVIRDVLGENAQPSSADDDLPDDLKQQKAALDAEKTNLRRQRQEWLSAKYKQLDEGVHGDANRQLDGEIDRVLNHFKVSDFNKATAKARIRAGLLEQFSKDQYYVGQRDDLARRSQTDDVRKQRVALLSNYARVHLMGVARPVLTELTETVKTDADKKLATATAQQANTKSEVKGAAALPVPAADTAPNAELLKYREDFAKSHNGKVPSMLDEVKYLTTLRAGNRR